MNSKCVIFLFAMIAVVNSTPIIIGEISDFIHKAGSIISNLDGEFTAADMPTSADEDDEENLDAQVQAAAATVTSVSPVTLPEFFSTTEIDPLADDFIAEDVESVTIKNDSIAKRSPWFSWLNLWQSSATNAELNSKITFEPESGESIMANASDALNTMVEKTQDSLASAGSAVSEAADNIVTESESTGSVNESAVTEATLPETTTEAVVGKSFGLLFNALKGGSERPIVMPSGQNCGGCNNNGAFLRPVNPEMGSHFGHAMGPTSGAFRPFGRK